MREFIESAGLMELNELTIVVRLVIATLLSGVLGIERTRKMRPAGLRTYMLVCIGSTVVMMTSQFLTMHYGGDPGRLPAQVVCGIGFLGAGTIMVTRYFRVKGLTTAAGLWVSACMGLAIGIGFYFGAIMTFLVLLFVMIFADRMEDAYTMRLRRLSMFIIFSDISDLKNFKHVMQEKGIDTSNVETTKSDFKHGIGLFCVLNFPKSLTCQEVLHIVEDTSGVLFTEGLSD